MSLNTVAAYAGKSASSSGLSGLFDQDKVHPWKDAQGGVHWRDPHDPGFGEHVIYPRGKDPRDPGIIHSGISNDPHFQSGIPPEVLRMLGPEYFEPKTPNIGDLLSPGPNRKPPKLAPGNHIPGDDKPHPLPGIFTFDKTPARRSPGDAWKAGKAAADVKFTDEQIKQFRAYSSAQSHRMQAMWIEGPGWDMDHPPEGYDTWKAGQAWKTGEAASKAVFTKEQVAEFEAYLKDGGTLLNGHLLKTEPPTGYGTWLTGQAWLGGKALAEGGKLDFTSTQGRALMRFLNPPKPRNIDNMPDIGGKVPPHNPWDPTPPKRPSVELAKAVASAYTATAKATK